MYICYLFGGHWPSSFRSAGRRYRGLLEKGRKQWLGEKENEQQQAEATGGREENTSAEE